MILARPGFVSCRVVEGRGGRGRILRGRREGHKVGKGLLGRKTTEEGRGREIRTYFSKT